MKKRANPQTRKIKKQLNQIMIAHFHLLSSRIRIKKIRKRIITKENNLKMIQTIKIGYIILFLV